MKTSQVIADAENRSTPLFIFNPLYVSVANLVILVGFILCLPN